MASEDIKSRSKNLRGTMCLPMENNAKDGMVVDTIMREVAISIYLEQGNLVYGILPKSPISRRRQAYRGQA
jgi:hypothetical protein